MKSSYLKTILLEILAILAIFTFISYSPLDTGITKFRAKSKKLSLNDVVLMLKKYDFSDALSYQSGKGFENHFELKVIEGDTVVIDHSSGLMWQRGGSSQKMKYKAVARWIKDINKKGFAGYKDWRLPTLEEAMSLVEPEKQNGLYIDPIFNKKQEIILTCDGIKKDKLLNPNWMVELYAGACINFSPDGSYVRAVRTVQLLKD